MRKHFKIAACFTLVMGITGMMVSTLFAYSGGPPDGRTGSPVDDLKTCNDTGCHNSYALNSGNATLSISAPGSFTSGETVNVTVSFGNSNTAKHGFELSALDANNSHAGTFSGVDTNTQTTDGNYIKHTSAGSSQSGNASWNVNWTAPSSEVQGPVTFYIAGNEANGDGTNQSDYIYTNIALISNASATPTATPTLPPPPTPPATLPPPPSLPPPPPTPQVTPSAAELCEPDSISPDKKQIKLKFGDSGAVTVTVSGENNCKSAGVTVNAVVKAGKKRVTVVPESVPTDENGQANFTITAGQKKGNAKIVFTVEDSEGEEYTTFIIAKVRKK